MSRRRRRRDGARVGDAQERAVLRERDALGRDEAASAAALRAAARGLDAAVAPARVRAGELDATQPHAALALAPRVDGEEDAARITQPRAELEPVGRPEEAAADGARAEDALDERRVDGRSLARSSCARPLAVSDTQTPSPPGSNVTKAGWLNWPTRLPRAWPMARLYESTSCVPSDWPVAMDDEAVSRRNDLTSAVCCPPRGLSGGGQHRRTRARPASARRGCRAKGVARRGGEPFRRQRALARRRAASCLALVGLPRVGAGRARAARAAPF